MPHCMEICVVVSLHSKIFLRVWSINFLNIVTRYQKLSHQELLPPPSAELAPDQIDQDSLPPYEVLDDILKRFVEEKQSVSEIIANGHSPENVNKITSLILRNEYKRRQSAPGPKVSSNAFGRERRYPMTSNFKP